MTIVQDAFYIPDDIATGLATGIYYRIGSVVRHAVGPHKGQIVKHLLPVDLNSVAKAQSLGTKILRFVQKNKKEIGIVVLFATVASAGWWGYTKWKNHEPKALTEFRTALKAYIEAIREGNMNTDKIDNLMASLNVLRKHKNYDKIDIQLTAEDLEVLVNHIYDYTIKLATDNNVTLTTEELCTNKGAILNLHSYLATQKKIFAAAM